VDAGAGVSGTRAAPARLVAVVLLERELRATLALAELELHRAGAELDRLYAYVEALR
jgi:hypothetical protein